MYFEECYDKFQMVYMDHVILAKVKNPGCMIQRIHTLFVIVNRILVTQITNLVSCWLFRTVLPSSVEDESQVLRNWSEL